MLTRIQVRVFISTTQVSEICQHFVNSNLLSFTDLKGIKYPPNCCSLPFTLNGVLHFHCVAGQNTGPGCFLPGRTWVPCTDPSKNDVKFDIHPISHSETSLNIQNTSH